MYILFLEKHFIASAKKLERSVKEELGRNLKILEADPTNPHIYQSQKSFTSVPSFAKATEGKADRLHITRVELKSLICEGFLVLKWF